ncbi:nuclear transport factor 2 family protein [Streptomyces ficellus]|uniref:Nuclear transport factor 2 family protein n=1 Tax=Streptomyces ficellus TaxID=1977088 RepID=A0A6I6FQ80_9ACTN|nr:nuclear transport factor 2 family protein [Streptomyces ficellus]QGV79758.1 nuclear transport factor 2 family protein [Streptomyces ficellus]
MSEHPDAALVRRGYEAFTRGDMAALGSLMTADCAAHLPGSNQVSGHCKGRDNVLERFGRLFELSGGSLRVDVHGVYVDGRGHVMTAHKWLAERGDRGIEMRGGLIITIVGGKMTDIDECVEDIDEIDAFWDTPA